MEALFKQMEDFAKENKVPIINENGRKVFIEIIKSISHKEFWKLVLR